jgi:hypothetical protein
VNLNPSVTVGWPISRDLAAGMGAMVVGVGLAVRLHPPSLALFIAGGALIGAGSGAIFKGAVGTVMSISPPERIAESLTGVRTSASRCLSWAPGSRSPATSPRRSPSSASRSPSASASPRRR